MDAPTVRYGIYLSPMGPLGDPAALVDLAVRAERSGWDGIFLWDHVVADSMAIADTWSTLAAIATATTSLRLGPMVTPLPRRRPWVVARQAATVSRLSRGRLILGCGLGSDETGDFARFGEATALSMRTAMLEEGLDVLRGIWSGQPYRHQGAHYRVDIVQSQPAPYRIPIWMASSTGSGRVLERATRCDGIFPSPEGQLLPEEVGALMQGLRTAGLVEERHFDVVVGGNASPAWPEAKDVDLVGLAQAGMTWWMESLIYFDPLELSLEVVDAGPPGR